MSCSVDLLQLSLKEGEDIVLKTKQKKWCIIDEKHLYVHGDSIKKIGNNLYLYTSYPQIERGYITYEAVENALSNLELHNKFGNLGHTFKIITY
jgi:hypothetical protein